MKAVVIAGENLIQVTGVPGARIDSPSDRLVRSTVASGRATHVYAKNGHVPGIVVGREE